MVDPLHFTEQMDRRMFYLSLPTGPCWQLQKDRFPAPACNERSANETCIHLSLSLSFGSVWLQRSRPTGPPCLVEFSACDQQQQQQHTYK